MGEVKVTIKIDNAMDVDMARQGLIAREKIRSVAAVPEGTGRSGKKVTAADES